MKIARNFGIYYHSFSPGTEYRLLHVALLHPDDFNTQCRKVDALCMDLNKHCVGHYVAIPACRFVSGTFPAVLNIDEFKVGLVDPELSLIF